MKILTRLLSILSICILFTGCGEEEIEVKPLKVGISTVIPPFSFMDEENNDNQGFDIDLIRAVSKEIERPVELVDIEFDELFPAVQSKDIDIAISAITINDARREYVLFSYPYFETGLQIIVRDDNTEIHSIEDLKGKRIAVYLGTTADTQAQQIEGATIIRRDAPAKCFDELEDGNADAVISDGPFNAYLLAQGHIANIKILPRHLTYEAYGIAMQKDQVELMQEINTALKKVRESGEYDRIYAKWFK